ncbi:transcriptional regulator, Crp/Fnr family [Candidatus Caldarchaeum subterraneum]|uniref:Transcriptional regulator, Crp/Fnr family n=1 Tax=Caldiarchaeum subterraneum TaxID=311458 RepID=E6N713_CALS0|nr:transcriptional regulator, Crp/Fnr family [Candidatus Caldarchaeum subterraneum]BAJ48089.1 transcriptional regulator, Crp/Fnr family [Candidatus Caldarchaeum subterraneum]BAJ50872.1 transcriptional regulator, Crp/Fnr family [Candidatus Caldarchaeum subterraneum]
MMSGHHVELLTLLKDHPFTKNMSEEKVMQLASISTLVRFSAGQKIFEEGEVHKRLYLIVYGLVALYFQIPTRGEFRFETIGSGEVLGWSSLMEPFKKTSGAVAVENTLAIAVDSEKLLRMMRDDPVFGSEVYRRIVMVVADRLRAARMRLLDIYGKAEEFKT